MLLCKCQAAEQSSRQHAGPAHRLPSRRRRRRRCHRYRFAPQALLMPLPIKSPSLSCSRHAPHGTRINSNPTPKTNRLAPSPPSHLPSTAVSAAASPRAARARHVGGGVVVACPPGGGGGGGAAAAPLGGPRLHPGYPRQRG